MNWMDLAIVCFCLWGGIKGLWLSTWQVMRKIGVVLASILLANWLQLYLKQFLVNVFKVDKIIEGAVFRGYIIPVYTQQPYDSLQKFCDELSLPDLVKDKIWLRVDELLGGGWLYDDQFYLFLELLIDRSVLIIAFALAFLLWMGWLHIIEDVTSPKLKEVEPNDGLSKWFNMSLGLAHHFTLAGLLTGILSVLLKFSPTFDFIDINATVLGGWCLALFQLFHIW